MVFFSNEDFRSPICCQFSGQFYFCRSYLFTLFQSNYLDTTVTFLERLFLQYSCSFWGAPSSEQSLFSKQLFFLKSYIFRSKLLPSSHFLRIGSCLGKLLFRTATFLLEELFRTKSSKEGLPFRGRYFCTTPTFSEKLHFGKIFQKSNIPHYLLFLESYFFRVATFLKDATF